ncbi:glycosyltransferase, partial [Campylobacter jejuni]|nr:glycosyltransferase [Campylobacter jejuni]
MQDKKVGIVIPIYNVEKYLDECLQSVIDQTYTNLSIVLVNDGSNDNSLSIAKKYALQDERIIIIDKKNGGLSSARNTGIDFFANQYTLQFE